MQEPHSLLEPMTLEVARALEAEAAAERVDVVAEAVVASQTLRQPRRPNPRTRKRRNPRK